ncbi:hypothetical protein CHUAL_004100 [Chamberlinius hualienensis]
MDSHFEASFLSRLRRVSRLVGSGHWCWIILAEGLLVDMSHQTGIGADASLRSFLGKCRDGDIRAVKVSIKNEALTLDTYRPAVGSWKEDYDDAVLSFVEEAQPCYILYRLDDKGDTGYHWLLISWSPDDSPIREKMLYASTKATLKVEFGSAQIKQELFANTRDEVSLKGFGRQKHFESAPAPLTAAEEELMLLKNDVNVDIGVDSRHQIVQGLSFPISDDAIAAIFQMRDRKINYIQLSINTDKEEINLAGNQNTNINQLAQRVPKDHPRYHLFSFPHTHEGDYLESVVFIYSMPGCECTIKERMLYSSCINPLLDVIQNRIGVEIIKRIQISEGEELTKEFLTEELHPTVSIFKQKFEKPKGPANRGARRVTKPKKDDDGVLV